MVIDHHDLHAAARPLSHEVRETLAQVIGPVQRGNDDGGAHVGRHEFQFFFMPKMLAMKPNSMDWKARLTNVIPGITSLMLCA